MEALAITDKTILSLDRDRTVRSTIKKIFSEYGDKYELYFANGGDQSNQSIPESKICAELDIKLLDGLGDKIQSSSWILKKYKKIQVLIHWNKPEYYFYI